MTRTLTMPQGIFSQIEDVSCSAASAGMGLGALNELVEFIATLLIPETNVGGYLNTGWDLVANFVGATLAAIIIFVRGTRREA